MSDQQMPVSGDAGPQFDKRQAIKLAVEFGPLLVFFLTNWQAGKHLADPKQAIFWGTGAFMVATILSLIVSRAVLGRIPTMPLVSGAFVLAFGGLTLWLQDDLFIKMKPTILNTLFGLILLGGLLFDKILLKLVFGDVMQLMEEGWRKLTVRWAIFFFVLALLNELIWRNFPTDTWVTFKVFGIMPLTFVFALSQIGLLKKYELGNQQV